MNTIPAIYEQGVFRPVTPVDLPEQTPVEVLMPPVSGGPPSSAAQTPPGESLDIQAWLTDFDAWLSRRQSYNPHVDDSRESIYPDRL